MEEISLVLALIGFCIAVYTIGCVWRVAKATEKMSKDMDVFVFLFKCLHQEYMEPADKKRLRDLQEFRVDLRNQPLYGRARDARRSSS